MKTFKKTIAQILMGAVFTSVAVSASAQEASSSDFEFSAGADLVSSYVWRGQKVGNFSIQPSVGASWKGLSLTAWGSSDLVGTNELDFTLGYSIKGFSVAVTDYFGPYGLYAGDFKRYFAGGNHALEGTIGFNLGDVVEKVPLSITWNTCFNYDFNATSSYFELGYTFGLPKGFGLDLALGFVPYADGLGLYGGVSEFNVTNISIKGTKEIKITESFSIPLFAQIVCNPQAETVHFVAGISF